MGIKKNLTFLFIIITVPLGIIGTMVLNGPTHSQPENPVEFPSIKNLTANISSVVQIGSVPGSLRYIYVVANDQNSQQELNLWGVQYKPDLEIEVIATPAGWSSNKSIGNLNIAGWSAYRRISPGSSEGGFGIEAVSLPSIVEAVYTGFIPIEQLPYFPEGAPEDLPGGSIFEDGTKTKTLGPVPLPTSFNSLEFIIYTISLNEQAYSLGWIDNSGIKTSLDAKLNAAKQALEMGDITKTKNILQAFLDEMESQKEIHLTSEAYGLLKYNALYLLDHL